MHTVDGWESSTSHHLVLICLGQIEAFQRCNVVPKKLDVASTQSMNSYIWLVPSRQITWTRGPVPIKTENGPNQDPSERQVPCELVGGHLSFLPCAEFATQEVEVARLPQQVRARRGGPPYT